MMLTFEELLQYLSRYVIEIDIVIIPLKNLQFCNYIHALIHVLSKKMQCGSQPILTIH